MRVDGNAARVRRMDARARFDEVERLRDAGRWREALALLRQTALDASLAFDPAVEATALLAMGELLNAEGDGAAAAAPLEEAIARSMEGGVPAVEARAHALLATLYFDAGRSKDGHDALLEAMALYRAQDDADSRRGLAVCMRLYGEHIGVLGSTEEAVQALRLAQAMFRDLGDEAAAVGIDQELARLPDYAR